MLNFEHKYVLTIIVFEKLAQKHFYHNYIRSIIRFLNLFYSEQNQISYIVLNLLVFKIIDILTGSYKK